MLSLAAAEWPGATADTSGFQIHRGQGVLSGNAVRDQRLPFQGQSTILSTEVLCRHRFFKTLWEVAKLSRPVALPVGHAEGCCSNSASGTESDWFWRWYQIQSSCLIVIRPSWPSRLGRVARPHTYLNYPVPASGKTGQTSRVVRSATVVVWRCNRPPLRQQTNE